MKFLIVKTSALGDIIHAFTALDYLRQKCPFAQIDWVVEAPFKSLVEAHPAVDRVLTIHTKKWRKNIFSKENRLERRAFRNSLRHYDVVFDLQGNIKSSWVLRQVKAKIKVGFGWSSAPEWPNCFFTQLKVNPPSQRNIRDDYVAIVQRYFQEESPFESSSFLMRIAPEEEKFLETVDERATLVCPGAAWKNKRLPEENLKNLLSQMQGPYYFTWGSDLERELVERVARDFPQSRVLPKLSLPLLQRIMNRCKLVVAMDSLPLHLCGTTRSASLSFFGPSSGKKYAPKGEQHRWEQGSCPYGQVFEKRCPRLRTCQSADCINKLKSR